MEAARYAPCAGIGKPEALLGNLPGYWSRRIDDSQRLVYAVYSVDDADAEVDADADAARGPWAQVRSFCLVGQEASRDDGLDPDLYGFDAWVTVRAAPTWHSRPAVQSVPASCGIYSITPNHFGNNPMLNATTPTMPNLLRRTLLTAAMSSLALMTACANLANGTGAAAPMNSAALLKLDNVIAADVASNRLPGAVMLVYRDGKVVHQRALGVLNAETKAPMPADGIFRIYSMTKPIVSVGLMMLVEDGKVRLDDPISVYMPEFKTMQLGVEKKDAGGNPVLERVPSPRVPTVQDLLRHTSGLTYGVFGKSLVKSEYLKTGIHKNEMNNTQLAQTLAALPLAYVPGAMWEYSRSTDLVGSLIERVSGQTLEAYLQQRILRPLQMKDSGFNVPADKQNRIAEPFKIDPDSKQPVTLLNLSKPAVFESGGGGMVSTAADYLRFARMVLNGGELDGVRILSPQTIKTMGSDHLGGDLIRASKVAGASTGYLPGPGFGFGLGYAVRQSDGEGANAGNVGEINWGGAGGTYFWIDPKANMIAIWMMQAPGQRVHYRHIFKNMVYGAF